MNSHVKRRVLINGVYTNAVGHVIEAFMFANALRNADPEVEIGILLNARSPLDLARCAAHLRITVYAVNLDRFSRPWIWLERFYLDGLVKRNWNWCIGVHDESDVTWPKGGPLRRFHQRFFAWTERNRIPFTVGYPRQRSNAFVAGGKMPPATPSSLKLQIPEADQEMARTKVGGGAGPTISLLLGSAEAQKSPGIGFWHELVTALLTKWPQATVVLIGVLGRGQGSTRNITRENVDQLLSISPQIKDAFNIGILPQLALCERSGVLISPHSGMAFAAQCVGTPWLALSGWKYHEYLTNGVPIYSLHPECPFYPCTPQNIKAECRTIADKWMGPVACFSDDALRKKIPSILEYAEKLISGELSYREWMVIHRRNLGARRSDGSLGVMENVQR
jgi:ADP-heptose:LPS heptosyltransferase